MKTNYKQSQAAPHAKPIFTVSRNDSTLYVLPAYLAGAVMIRLQHIADGDKVKKLCCKVKNDRLMAMEQDVPQGNVTLTAVDIISPEKCAEKGYRKDGYGYVRTLLVTPTAEHRAMFSITCTLGERDSKYLLPLTALPKDMPLHYLRAQYAQDLYRYFAERGTATGNMYYCRAERKGQAYDKGILLAVSQQMGHSRCDVVVSHYLY